jgi:hypothetical protein
MVILMIGQSQMPADWRRFFSVRQPARDAATDQSGYLDFAAGVRFT